MESKYKEDRSEETTTPTPSPPRPPPQKKTHQTTNIKQTHCILGQTKASAILSSVAVRSK